MSKFTQKQNFLFGRFPIQQAQITHDFGSSYNLYQNMGIGKWSTVATLRGIGDSYTNASVAFNDPKVLDFLQAIHRCEFQLTGLGEGVVCPSCGDYSPTGAILCMRCGSLMEKVPFVKPEPLDLRLTHQEVNGDTFTTVGFNTFIVELSIREDQVKYLLNVKTPLYNTITENNHYLCQWCGMAVPEEETCPGCAGTRLPLQELISMDKKCLYCDNEAFTDGYCDGCGARLHGVTLADYLYARKTL